MNSRFMWAQSVAWPFVGGTSEVFFFGGTSEVKIIFFLVAIFEKKDPFWNQPIRSIGHDIA